MSQEEKLLLWVFYADDGKYGEINHTYARTKVEAMIQMQAWVAQQVLVGREDITVRHWPGGFQAGARVRWPGSISAAEASHVAISATN